MLVSVYRDKNIINTKIQFNYESFSKFCNASTDVIILDY